MRIRFPRLLVIALAAAGCGAATSVAVGATYVALGDSYSSGVGTGSYTLSSTCKRSVYAYPYLFASGRAGTSLTFLACTGAKTTDVLSNQVSTQPPMPKADVVTVTAGGNDIGFSSLISQCVTSDCTAAIASAKSWASTNLPGLLASLYGGIAAHLNTNAHVVVLGYPKLFPETKSCTTGITVTEEKAANDLATTIDGLTGTAAAAYGNFTYKSAIAPFAGHDVCAGSKAWLNNLNLLNTSESFHPNRTGHAQGYLPLVTAAVP